MAQGDFTLFEEFSKTVSGTVNLTSSTFKIALITNAVVAVAATATPQLTDFTQVSGGGYTAGGETLAAKTWTEAAGVATFDDTGTPAVSWTKNGTGPTNIYQAILYDDTAAGDDAVGFIDMTTDGGTTPISLQSGDITITPHASGFFTLS
jgi:hypothetical protein